MPKQFSRCDPTIDDAMYRVALQRYIIRRWSSGEVVTLCAADKIRAILAADGLNATSDLSEHGFLAIGDAVRPSTPENLLAALRIIRKHGRTEHLHAICNLFIHASVADLERVRC